MAVLQSTLRLTLLDNVSGPARKISGVLGTFQRQQMSFMGPMRGIMGQMLAFGGAYLGVTKGISGTAGAAMEFESAFADVRKVVEANEEQFANMRRTILKMSTELPLAASDIAALFAAAGEAGVATVDLKAFSEMAARVGIAFDMSAGDAGEALAKLKTQLGLTVEETGSMADSINHLSNNMASKAKDITEFMLRVGALAEMGGFAKEEIAAIGSAMIAAGAQSETAATAMQNVVKAMTRGSFAKKSQAEAAKALGLDLPLIAKQMQKDAPKALKKVLGAIAKAPKSQHIALLSQFFGDEAKAFAPLIGNIGLLDQALGSVSDKTKYAGSAFREYVARANTTANVLQLLRNRFAEVGVSIGDKMLPSIREAALGIGDVLDTLGERATVFDKMGTAMQAFMQGFGIDGGVRQTINDLGDLLFGEANGSEAADKLGRIFANFRKWGEDVRYFTDAVAANPIAKFFADMAPYGFKLMLWSTGILMLAGTIRKLAAALMFLSGASAVLGILKTLKGLHDIGRAGSVGAGSQTTGTNQKAGSGGAPWFSVLGNVIGLVDAVAGMPKTKEGVEALIAKNKERSSGWNKLLEEKGISPNSWMPKAQTSPGVYSALAMDNARGARAMGIGGNTTETLPGKTADDLAPIRIDSSSISAMTQPNGVQSVLVTNPQAPTVTVHAPITITGVSDPAAAADSAASQLGEKVKGAVESGYSD